jgi:hypothetical protein
MEHENIRVNPWLQQEGNHEAQGFSEGGGAGGGCRGNGRVRDGG